MKINEILVEKELKFGSDKDTYRSRTGKTFHTRVIDHFKYWIDAVRHQYITHWSELSQYMREFLRNDEYRAWKKNFNGKFPTRLKVQLDLLRNLTANYYDNKDYDAFKEDYTDAMIKFANLMQKYYNQTVGKEMQYKGMNEENDIETATSFRDKDGNIFNNKEDDMETGTIVKRGNDYVKLQAGEKKAASDKEVTDQEMQSRSNLIKKNLDDADKEREKMDREAGVAPNQPQQPQGTVGPQ